MRILHARLSLGHGIEIARRPEGIGQLLVAKRDVEALGLLDEPAWLPALHQRVHVDALDETGPALTPTVADPMRGHRARHIAHAVARRVLMARPAMKLVVERTHFLHETCEQRHHLVHAHAVVRDHQLEVVVVAHLARHTVAQFAQLHEAIAQHRADLFAGLPGMQALIEITRLTEDAIELIGDHRTATRAVIEALQTELIAIQTRTLRGLSRNTPTCEIRGCLRCLRGLLKDGAKLPLGEVIELVLVLHQKARATNDLDTSSKCRERLIGRGATACVLGRDIGRGEPACTRTLGRERDIRGLVEIEQVIGLGLP